MNSVGDSQPNTSELTHITLVGGSLQWMEASDWFCFSGNREKSPVSPLVANSKMRTKLTLFHANDTKRSRIAEDY